VLYEVVRLRPESVRHATDGKCGDLEPHVVKRVLYSLPAIESAESVVITVGREGLQPLSMRPFSQRVIQVAACSGATNPQCLRGKHCINRGRGDHPCGSRPSKSPLLSICSPLRQDDRVAWRQRCKRVGSTGGGNSGKRFPGFDRRPLRSGARPEPSTMNRGGSMSRPRMFAVQKSKSIWLAWPIRRVGLTFSRRSSIRCRRLENAISFGWLHASPHDQPCLN